MTALIVKFKSGLSLDELLRISEERADGYRAIDGLQQKYYLKYSENEYGAVYIWDSEEDIKQFRESDRAKTIASAYKVEGTPEMTVAEVVMTLREDQLA